MATNDQMRTSCRRRCWTLSSVSTADEYEVVEMMQETFLDLDQISELPRRGQEIRAEAR